MPAVLDNCCCFYILQIANIDCTAVTVALITSTSSTLANVFFSLPSTTNPFQRHGHINGYCSDQVVSTPGVFHPLPHPLPLPAPSPQPVMVL